MIDKTVCVVDNGLFVELAKRLSRDYKRVLYCLNSRSPFPRVNEACIGDVEGVERIENIWDHLSEINTFCFPDIGDGALQRHLITEGRIVWGSQRGDCMELKRQQFKEDLKKLGLAVGKFHVAEGLTELRDYLSGKEDQYVKVSRFRGSCETWHWVNEKISEDKFTDLEVSLGPLREKIKFIVEEAIPTKIEWGYDGYFCGGRFPNLSAQGPEIKDKCYISAITKEEDLPEPIRMVNSKISSALKFYGYCNFFSTEIRISEDDTPYFIDPCCRMPSPAGEAQMELYGNLGEIIQAGAEGECIDPEPTAKFCVEAIIEHNGDLTKWRKVVVREDVRRWFKFWNVCEIPLATGTFLDNVCAIPPLPHSHDSIGAVLGLGDTLEEAISHLKKNVETIKDQPVTVHVDALADALAEIHAADQKGVEMTSQEVPEPSVVIDDA